MMTDMNGRWKCIQKLTETGIENWELATHSFPSFSWADGSSRFPDSKQVSHLKDWEYHKLEKCSSCKCVEQGLWKWCQQKLHAVSAYDFLRTDFAWNLEELSTRYFHVQWHTVIHVTCKEKQRHYNYKASPSWLISSLRFQAAIVYEPRPTGRYCLSPKCLKVMLKNPMALSTTIPHRQKLNLHWNINKTTQKKWNLHDTNQDPCSETTQRDHS